jgi:hypothetical protein
VTKLLDEQFLPPLTVHIFSIKKLIFWIVGVVGRYAKKYRLVWAKKGTLAAICLEISSASFGIRIN